MARIGVAISGGGHRATAWGIGALLALTDMELNSRVVSISSVSGGSIANGVVAQHGDFSSMDSAALEQAIRPLAHTMASDGLFFFGPATDGWMQRFFVLTGLFIDLVVALGVAGVAGGRRWAPGWWLLVGPVLAGLGWFAARTFPPRMRATVATVLAMAGPITAAAVAATTGGSSRLRIGLALLVLLVLTVAAFLVVFRMFANRSQVVDRALAHQHFRGLDGRPTLLSACESPVHHVFCASELQSGDHMYFSPRLVYGYRIGRGMPGALTLATTVQCSACLPGAFAPRRLPTAGFGLTRPWTVEENNPPTIPELVALNDGGVYDNMADQWEQGLEARRDRIGPVQEAAEELVVVNASRSLAWRPYGKGLFANELAGVTKTGSILYDVSTSHRRQALIARFNAASRLGGLQGALVNIAQSPYTVPGKFRQNPNEAGERARIALDALKTLGRTKAEWQQLALENARVKTTLAALTPPVTAALIEHAWVLTVVNLYVILGYGADQIANLATLGAPARFEALCS
ncbi:MAG: hypothetical protein ACRD2W_13735 [Acidimicrobiales bacterium]